MAISKKPFRKIWRAANRIVLFTSGVLLLSSFTGLDAQITFTKVTIDELVEAAGASWVDYDNDGDLDLFRVAAVGIQDNRLHQNNGDGTFTNLHIEAFIGSGRFRSTVHGGNTWGDYDNDGDLDLFVSNILEDNFFYENNGDGSFRRRTDVALANDGGDSQGGSWGDYNNDGKIDLFVANAGEESNFLYQNMGDGNFRRETSGSIVSDVSSSWEGLWADYDNDGDLDLFVANGIIGNNSLYRNNSNSGFTKQTSGTIVSHNGSEGGGSWGDYDNDGDLDLVVLTRRRDVPSNFLYQNNGDGTFSSITNSPIVTDPRSNGGSASSSWGDYDNDGDLDLLVSVPDDVGNLLYLNDGTGSFVRTSGGDIDDSQGGNTVIAGDYDNDGDLDIALGCTGCMFRNDGINNNNWLKIKCVGTISNQSGIGAKVRIQTTINGKEVWQLREISGQTGNNSQNSLVAHFGLGDAMVIDTVRIEWPSGQVQLLTDIAVNQFLPITENRPPLIDTTPISIPIDAAGEVTVEASVTATDLAETKLLFRQGGDNAFTSIPMSDLGNDSFQGIIPASAVTAKGVEYSFEATDVAGNTARLPRDGSFSLRVNVPSGISRGVEEPFGSDQTAYHLFSVPLDLQDKSPSAILEDDMGEYDDSRWRFLEYVPGDQTFRDFPEIEQLQPGKGYWFLVTEPARVIDTPGGTSFTTSEPRSVLVRNGWNLIGNPFNFVVPTQNIKLDLSAVELRTFNGSWNNPISDPVTEMRPFEGYAVMIDDFAAEIFIDPNVPVVGLAENTQESASKNLSFLRRQESPSTEARNREIPAQGRNDIRRNILWSINVQAQCQQARDVDNVLGVADQASESWDRLDYPEPPPIGKYVSVHFDHPEWGKHSQRFCTDFRPAIGATVPAERSLRGASATKQSPGHEHKTRRLLRPEKHRTRNDGNPLGQSHIASGHIWEFDVQTNIRDRVELTFAGIETVPQEFNVWLVDEALGLTQNLRSKPRFSVAGVGESHPTRLKLLVGLSDFVNDELPQQKIHTDFELSQNFPNPFNPVTSIRYGLPREERVTLKIFNILGEEVATLLADDLQPAGYQVAIWDGRDRQGRQVASGVYVYQIVAGDSRISKKMALVR